MPIIDKISSVWPKTYGKVGDMSVSHTLHKIEQFPANVKIGYLISGLVIAYFIGMVPAVAYFIIYYSLAKQLSDKAVYLNEAIQANEIDYDEAERSIIGNIFYIGFVSGIFYLWFNLQPDNLISQISIFLIASKIGFLNYRLSSSKRAVIAGILPIAMFIILASIVHSIRDKNISHIFIPIPYLYTVFLVIHTIVKDKIAAIEIIIENQNKAEELEKSLRQHKKETKIRYNVERVASVGTFTWQFNNAQVSWSPGAYKAFDFDENEPIPTKEEFIDRIIEADKKRYLQQVLDSKDTNHRFDFNFSIYNKDRSAIKHIQCFAEPIYDENNIIIGVDGIVIDQSESRNALDETNAIHSLLKMALNNARSAVLVHDFESKKMQAYGAIDIFGIKASENDADLSKKISKALSRKDTNVIFNSMIKAEQTGNIETIEHSIINDKGEKIDIRFTMQFDKREHDNKGRLVALTTDITQEVKRRKELFDALEEAKRASRVKSEFLANMSHEIRTPLNGVIAIADILAKTELNKEQRDMIGLIESSGESLKIIINDILDLARVESGHLEIEKIEFNLKESLASHCSLFAIRANEKGIEFKTEIDDLADNIFIGDPNRIRQIINNLLSNSVKFTSSGYIALKAKIRKDKRSHDKYFCEFIVEDTGKGISRKDIKRLFERFEQVDGSITREHGGSGLGLAISKSLAQIMGGKIFAKSKLGKGTIMTLKLQLELSRTSAKTTIVKESEPIASIQDNDEEISLNILGVDDNATNRKVMQLILEPLGINLTLAGNGKEAIDLFNTAKFDVILMDLQMPIMDGLSATTEIRKIEREKGLIRTPIIAVSANAMAHHKLEAINAGADIHIAKPFTAQTLLNGIDEAFEIIENNDNFSVNAN